MWAHEVLEHGDEEHPVVYERQYGDQVSLQDSMTDASQQIDSFKSYYISIPHENEDHIIFWGEVDSANPLYSEYGSMVTYDRDTGAHLSNWDIREVSFGWQLVDTFRKLHFGYFAGLFSKVLWAFIGLSPVWLAGTGFYLWYVRKRRKSESKRNRKARVSQREAHS